MASPRIGWGFFVSLTWVAPFGSSCSGKSCSLGGPVPASLFCAAIFAVPPWQAPKSDGASLYRAGPSFLRLIAGLDAHLWFDCDRSPACLDFSGIGLSLGPHEGLFATSF